MAIEKVLVVGAGQMGHGIAQVCVTGGAEVKLFDASEEAAQSGYDKILAAVKRGVEKGRYSDADMKDIAARLKRISDGKEFILGLSELKAIDKKSENYQLLDDFSVWFVNSK